MAKPYIVEISVEARADLLDVPPFYRSRVLKALTALEDQAEIETRQRKPLKEPLEELPDASWEVRVGDYRALYEITLMAPDEPGEGKTARVLRVILKGAWTMRGAVSRAEKP
jgi:mRNA-degrading endonuclease RelE of RelBE toxin-antitoxin system